MDQYSNMDLLWVDKVLLLLGNPQFVNLGLNKMLPLGRKNSECLFLKEIIYNN